MQSFWGILIPEVTLKPTLLSTPPNADIPIVNRKWRGTTVECDLVSQFFDSGERDSPYDVLAQTAALGDALIAHYGSLHMAIRAVQELKFADRQILVENAATHLGSDPELRGDIMELHRLGATPRYRGESPGEFRVRRFPRNPAQQGYILDKLWGYTQQGKMFVFANTGIPAHDQYMASPPTTVAKKLPDRAISSELMAIWDGRRMNLFFPKYAYWPLITPKLDDLARRYCHLKSSSQCIDIIGTKRDIDAACAR